MIHAIRCVLASFSAIVSQLIVPRTVTRLPFGLAGLATALTGLATPAHATCWTGGSADIAQLQRSADTNPANAAKATKARLAIALRDQATPHETLGRLYSVSAAALSNSENDEEAREAARAGLALSGISAPLRAELLGMIATTSVSESSADLEGTLMQLRALAPRFRAGTPASICAGNAIFQVLMRSGDSVNAMKEGVAAYRSAKERGLESHAAAIAARLAILMRETGDLDQAENLLDEVHAWAQRGDFTFYQLYAAFMRGTLYEYRKQDSRAARSFLEAADLAHRLGTPQNAALIEVKACELLLKIGRVREAARACQAAQRDRDPDAANAIIFESKLGETELALGRPEQALAFFNSALAHDVAPGYERTWNRVLELRAQTHALLGQHDAAYRDLSLLARRMAEFAAQEETDRIAEIRGEFVADQQRLAAAELGRNVALAHSRAEARQRLLFIGLGSAALIAALLVWTIVRSSRQRRHLEAMAEEARKLAEAKANMLSTMSREIRSPLEKLTDAAQALARSNAIPDPARSRADQLGRVGGRLTGLIDDLVLFSRIDARQLPVSIKPFDPRALLPDIAAIFEAKAAEAGLAIICQVSDQLPSKIDSDPDRIAQIVTNFLENAIRYSGGTAIHVKASRPYPGQIEIAVIDDGQGISPVEQALLFKRFSRVDGSSSPKGGSGLGLAICKGLADLLGGRIVLESDVGKGVRVSLSLPCSVSADEQVANLAILKETADA